jgi:hypothetical protein
VVALGREHFPYEVRSKIGRFLAPQDEERAAIKRLSILIKKYPYTTKFRIFGSYPEIRGHGSLVYTRVWLLKRRMCGTTPCGDNILFRDLRPLKKAPFSMSAAIEDGDIIRAANESDGVDDIFHRADKRFPSQRAIWSEPPPSLGHTRTSHR